MTNPIRRLSRLFSLKKKMNNAVPKYSRHISGSIVCDGDVEWVHHSKCLATVTGRVKSTRADAERISRRRRFDRDGRTERPRVRPRRPVIFLGGWCLRVCVCVSVCVHRTAFYVSVCVSANHPADLQIVSTLDWRIPDGPVRWLASAGRASPKWWSIQQE